MDSRFSSLPDDIEALKAALIAEAARAKHAEAELAVARAKASDDQALIAHQQLRIEKLTRQLYGPRSERTSRLLDQIELQFEELESSATEDEIAAETAVAKTTTVASFTRKRPARKPFPEHLPRERVIVPGPAACLCCDSDNLVHVPTPGSKAFHRYTGQCPSPAGQYRGRQHRRLWPQSRDRCSRTKICEPQGRSCGCGGSARHIGRQRRPAPRPATARSSAQIPQAAACPAAPKSACPSPSYR